jgi:glycosyltransferase involved in cell wall biosynthesis
MSNFDYSVVIATYNRAKYLEGCLKTFMEPAAEGLVVVVVDDGSTDSSPMLVRKLAGESRGARIHLLQQSNSGVGAARNRGVAETKTPYVFFLDDDDRWFPWTVQAAQQLVSQTPEASMFLLRIAPFTDEAQLDSLHQMPLEVTSHSSFFDFYLNPPISIYGSCNVGVRRDAFTSVDGFDPAFQSGEDIDLFFRMSAQGQVTTAVEPVLVGYRANTSGSLSKNSKQQMQGARLVMGRYLRGELTGSPETMQSAMTRYALIRFRTLLNRGETLLARQLLRDATPILKMEKGYYFLARLHLVLLKRKFFPKKMLS